MPNAAALSATLAALALLARGQEPFGGADEIALVQSADIPEQRFVGIPTTPGSTRDFRGEDPRQSQRWIQASAMKKVSASATPRSLYELRASTPRGPKTVSHKQLLAKSSPETQPRYLSQGGSDRTGTRPDVVYEDGHTEDDHIQHVADELTAQGFHVRTLRAGLRRPKPRSLAEVESGRAVEAEDDENATENASRDFLNRTLRSINYSDEREMRTKLRSALRQHILLPCPEGYVQIQNETVYPNFFFEFLRREHEKFMSKIPERIEILDDSHPKKEVYDKGDKAVHKRAFDHCQKIEDYHRHLQGLENEKIREQKKQDRENEPMIRFLYKSKHNVTMHDDKRAYYNGLETLESQVAYLKSLYKVPQKSLDDPKTPSMNPDNFVVMDARRIHCRDHDAHEYWLHYGPSVGGTELYEEPQYMTEKEALTNCTKQKISCGGIVFNGPLSKDKKWIYFKRSSHVHPWPMGKKSNIIGIYKKLPITAPNFR